MNFECPFCHELGDADGTQSNGLCMAAPCGHVYHKSCLLKWQEASRGPGSTCAICRQLCQKIWTLYGAIGVSEDASRNVTPTQGTTGSSDQISYEDLTILCETLKDDVERLKKQLRDAQIASRRRDRRSDQKDLEIMRLQDQIKRMTE